MADVHQSIVELLESTPVSKVRTGAKPVTCCNDEIVEQVIAKLSKENIQSVPLVEKDSKACSGMVDMLDIVLHLLTVAPGSIPEKIKPVLDPFSVQENEVRELNIAGRKMSAELVGNVAGCSARNPLVPTHDSSSIIDIVNQFANGAHRAPVLSEQDGTVLGTVSQSNVVAFLADVFERTCGNADGRHHTHALPSSCIGAVAMIPAYRIGTHKVKSISPTATVLQGIEQLYDDDVGSLAVVNEVGVLEGNFSASDLKALFQEKTPSFFTPINEYLHKHRPESRHCVVCTWDTSLANICIIMRNCRVHRVWIVDDDFCPVGLVSMTDIMSALARTAQEFPSAEGLKGLKGEDAESNPVLDFFTSFTLDSLDPSSPVHCVRGSDTVETLVQTMRTHRVSSCPVLGEVDGSRDGGEDESVLPVSMADMLDIVLHVLVAVKESGGDQAVLDDKLRNTKVSEISSSSGRNPMVQLTFRSSLAEVVRYFSLGVHRSPVVDEVKGNVVAAASQSDMIRFLNQHWTHSALKDIGFSSLQEIGERLNVELKVKTVKESNTVEEAITKLYNGDVSCLAVVDDKGTLQGAFSARDLQALFESGKHGGGGDAMDEGQDGKGPIQPLLDITVRTFLAVYRPASRHCLTCRPDSVLADICSTMAVGGVHQVWVTDNMFRPVGVVSISDVMVLLHKAMGSP